MHLVFEDQDAGFPRVMRDERIPAVEDVPSPYPE